MFNLWNLYYKAKLARLALFGKDFLFLCTVTATSLLTTFDRRAIERAADDLVTNAREVADTTAADQHDRVFLELVTFARNVARDFFVVREANTRNLTKCGIRLLRLHRTN